MNNLQILHNKYLLNPTSDQSFIQLVEKPFLRNNAFSYVFHMFDSMRASDPERSIAQRAIVDLRKMPPSVIVTRRLHIVPCLQLKSDLTEEEMVLANRGRK